MSEIVLKWVFLRVFEGFNRRIERWHCAILTPVCLHDLAFKNPHLISEETLITAFRSPELHIHPDGRIRPFHRSECKWVRAAWSDPNQLRVFSHTLSSVRNALIGISSNSHEYDNYPRPGTRRYKRVSVLIHVENNEFRSVAATYWSRKP